MFKQNSQTHISGKFDSTWVSTDHPAIKECALACGARVFERGLLMIMMINDDVDNENFGNNDYVYREMCALACGARVFERGLLMMIMMKSRWYS